MKRLLPAVFGLSLLLTACPGATPELPVPTGASVLNGEWRGTLREAPTLKDVSASPERVFELRDFGSRQQVTVRRLSDGAVLAERSFSNGWQWVVWRADGALLLGSNRSWQRLDPETLAVQEERPLPAALLGFSADGSVAQLADGTRLDTRTGKALAPAQHTFENLHTSDDSWRIDDDGKKATRLADGFAVSLAPGHGNPCRTWGGPTAYRVETLLGGGLAVGYSDTVVELRTPDGTLRRAVRLDTSCLPVQAMRRWGNELLAAAWSGTTGKLALHTLTDGGEAARPAASLVVNPQAYWHLLVPSGVVTAGSVMQVVLQDGTGWVDTLKTLPLTLKVRAEYVNEREYRFGGSAQLGGETLTLAGTSVASGITLKPAGTPQFVTWQADLLRTDGQKVSTLKGGHGATGAIQSVALTVDDVSYGGELRRP